MDTQRFVRYALSLAITTLFLLHIAGVSPIPFLDTLENLAYDARLKLMLPRPTDKH